MKDKNKILRCIIFFIVIGICIFLPKKYDDLTFYILLIFIPLACINEALLARKLEIKKQNDYFNSLRTNNDKSRTNNYENFHDKLDWYYDTCCEIYLNQTGKSLENLTNEDEQIIWKYSATFIGFIYTWLFKNDFYAKEIHEDDDLVNKVKTGELAGADYVVNYCDYGIGADDIKSEILPFIADYYGDISDEYENFTRTVLGKEPYSFISTYDDYLKFEKIINEKYLEYKNNK